MTPERQAIIDRIKARQAGAQAAPEASPQPSQGMASGLFDAVTQGATLGFGDELTGIEAAILGKTPEGDWFNYEQPFSERYGRAVAAERGQQDQFREDNTATSIGGEILGGMATGGGLARQGLTLMGRGAGTGRNVVGGIVEGAAYGGAYGAGSADQNDRLSGAMTGAAAGGATGGALAAGGSTISKIINNRRAGANAPTASSVKGQGAALLERAKEANPRFEGFDELVMDVYRRLPDEGFDPVQHPQLARWLEGLEELSTGGTAPDYRQLDMLRKRLRSPASNFNNPEEQRLAMMTREALDRFMASGRPVTGGLPATADDVASMGQREAAEAAMADVRQGRELYRRGKNMERMEQGAYKADLNTATSGSGGNIDNNIRREVKRLLVNPKTRARLNAAEIEQLESIVRGGPVENALRLVGKLGPQGNGLMMALNVAGPGVATAMTGNPLFMAPPVIGGVAKALADRATQSNVSAIAPVLASGGARRSLAAPAQLGPRYQALIDALAAQSGGVTNP